MSAASPIIKAELNDFGPTQQATKLSILATLSEPKVRYRKVELLAGSDLA
jgi:hypothetical protein